jgi:hypothetical protein
MVVGKANVESRASYRMLDHFMLTQDTRIRE